MTEPLRQLIDQGGWVMIAIATVSFLAWALILWEWLRLREKTAGGWQWAERAIEDLAHHDRAPSTAPARAHGSVLGQVFRGGLMRRATDRAAFEAQVMPLLHSETVLLERPLRQIAALATSMPLLGLLGTVLGMMQTFHALTQRGTPGIDALADGISQALITTQAGLVVAVPVLLMHGYLAARVRRYLDQTGILIKRMETVICRD